MLGGLKGSSDAGRVDWTGHCAAVIPALDEARVIQTLVREVKRYLPNVLVVDDGSKDDTAALACKAGAEILRHDSPKGKGHSLRAGWQWAAKRGFSWALCLDGDGQHAPADIPRFFAHAESTDAPLIVGNRMQEQTAMPLIRRWTNRWMSRQISRLAGVELPDSQCGYRLMNLAAWKPLPVEAGHFEIESDVLLAFIQAGYRVEFVPIRVIYSGERSKINPLNDVRRWFRWWRKASAKKGRYNLPSRMTHSACR